MASAQGLYIPDPLPDDMGPRPSYRQSENQFPPPGGRLGGGFIEYVLTGGRPVPVAPEYAETAFPNFVHRPYAQPGDRRSDYGGVAAGPPRSDPRGAVYEPRQVVYEQHPPTYAHRASLPQGGLPPFLGGGTGPSTVPPSDAFLGDASQMQPQPVAYNAPTGLEALFGVAPAPTEAAPARVGIDPLYERQVVAYSGRERPGTIVIDTPDKFLYLVQGEGRAIRYGIGVGRPGFTWAGVKTVSRKAEWPGWTPPSEMMKRRPDLPRHMVGGEANPLGARALYLGSSMYRIHGTNEPDTIGTNVSSGCIRMMNQDVIDLYGRVPVGTRVVVL